MKIQELEDLRAEIMRLSPHETRENALAALSIENYKPTTLMRAVQAASRIIENHPERIAARDAARAALRAAWEAERPAREAAEAKAAAREAAQKAADNAALAAAQEALLEFEQRLKSAPYDDGCKIYKEEWARHEAQPVLKAINDIFHRTYAAEIADRERRQRGPGPTSGDFGKRRFHSGMANPALTPRDYMIRGRRD